MNTTSSTSATTVTTKTTCIDRAIPSQKNVVRVHAPIAPDFSFVQYTMILNFDDDHDNGHNGDVHKLQEMVKVTMSGNNNRHGDDDRVLILIETVANNNDSSSSSTLTSTADNNENDNVNMIQNYHTTTTVHFVGSIAYQPTRSGTVRKPHNDTLVLEGAGLPPERTVRLVLDTVSSRGGTVIPPSSTPTGSDDDDDDDNNNNSEELIVPLPPVGGLVGLSSTDTPIPASQMQAELEELERTLKQKHHDLYPNNDYLAQVSMATQAAVLFNWIYTPAELSPVAPVSRGWNHCDTSRSTDFHYVLFNWDNVLASYILAYSDPKQMWDNTTKNMAYSNLIQTIRSRTGQGFIPNWSAGGSKSQDRTEPPLATKVLEELFHLYQEEWIVELLWDDLADYMDWFFRKRILSPGGLIALGSNKVDYKDRSATNDMWAARLESGLDNSPMYDGRFFDNETSLMQMYDVGMTSLVIQECDSLARLALVAGKSQEEATFWSRRADSLRSKLSSLLWDDAQGIFANRHKNGTFCRRITPTSFYPLLAQAVLHESQTQSMVERWLLNKTRFCIDPSSSWPVDSQNSDDCWWGLPSISADDPAFPKLGYWRGYVWGPMVQLLYWSLQQSSHLEVVRTARQALCKQTTAMFLTMWNRHGHVCENFSPHRHADDCTGDNFYHWGALGGLISLLEAKSRNELKIGTGIYVH